MDRVDVPLPDPVIFSTTLTVRVGDINYGGHLGNDRLLTLIHESRVQLLKTWGWSELDCAGVALIQAEAAVMYRAEAFLGDALLFAIGFGEISRCGFEVRTVVTRPSDEKEIARVHSGLVCFDYQRRKVVAMPPDLKARLTGAGMVTPQGGQA